MGGGTEADLTHGAVAAMSGRPAAEGPLRPVLQLAEAPWLAGIHNPTERYGVLLVQSQEAVLAASMNGLVHAGLLRRVLDYVCSTSVENRRVIIVIQLEILQTECTLIGSPTIYEVNAVQPKMGPYSDSLGVYRHCMISGGKQGVTKIACSPDQSWLGSSKAARKFTRNTIDAKMHQLSLSSYQGQVPSIVGGFDCPGNTYGHPMQPLYQERPPMNMNTDPVANNEARVMPIAALSPYQGRWTIKARVAGKTKLRYLGKGKVFSFDLLDARGGQIRATGFNSAVDQFYDQVVAGNVYWISGGFFKPAAKMYNPFNSDYQIILDSTTSIEIYSGDDSGIPWQKYSFRQLCEIEIMKNGDMVDLLGVVTSVSPSVKIVRNALETNKRTIQLKDLSGRAVAIILWGDFCNAEGKQLQLQLDSGLNPILALKGGCVNGNDKSVGTTSSSWLKIDPDLLEADYLRNCQWYRYATTESKNNVCLTIAQIKDVNFGMSHQPDLITVVAAISYVHTDAFCYPACTLTFSGNQCNRKVRANGDGWWCKRCLQSFETCEYRYMLMCQIQDHTGSTYATAFHEAAEGIIGHKAAQLFVMKHFEEDDAEVEEIMQGILWGEYRFQLRVKEGVGHGVKKFGIVKAEKLDPSDMSRHVLGEIDDLLKVDSSSAPGATQGIVTPSTRRMSIDDTSSSQAGLTTQTSDNAYGGAMTIGSTGYGHPAPVRRQMPTPPQATPSVQAECFKCSRGARSAMIPVVSSASEAPSMQAECFRRSRGARSPMI